MRLKNLFLVVLFFSPLAAYSANEQLVLNLNGADGATTTTDTSANNFSFTFNGNAQLDTAAQKFGSASLLGDGNGDYISTAYNATAFDIFSSSSSNYTVSMFVKLATASNAYLIDLYADSSNFWALANEDKLYLYLRTGATWRIATSSTKITDTTSWHHLAICKVGTNIGVYLDGTQVQYKSLTTGYAVGSGTFKVGGDNNATEYWNGWTDDVLVFNSNYFSAAPNSGKTNTITVPIAEYSTASTVQSNTVCVVM